MEDSNETSTFFVFRPRMGQKLHLPCSSEVLDVGRVKKQNTKITHKKKNQEQCLTVCVKST